MSDAKANDQLPAQRSQRNSGKLLPATASYALRVGWTIKSSEISYQSDTADLPVISVSEPSPVLSTILLLIYPCRIISLTDLDLVLDIIKAHDKYDINTSGLHQLSLHDLLVSDGTLLENPLGAYTVAWRLGMKEAAQNASRYLHTLNLHDKAVKDEFLSWAESGRLDALSALWDLRVRREKQLDGLIDAAHALSTCPLHRLKASQASIRDKARVALSTPHPSCLDLRSFLNLRSLSSGWSCVPCQNYMVTPRSEDALKGDMYLVSSFPQTVDWGPM
ncbi:hypothetical protein FRB95_012499 [Tulasnella sp. JGI-2019a]|nr:hypothetical protein FRB95_012499 [Tulasnella sp. JGI-2019a]